MLWTKGYKPVLYLAGHLKKGARLELSLAHQLFNLGNNKNIKWIPVFLCYNRSTTEWKRRDSETKPMTSERNKRVEEGESTNRRAGRWQGRPSEQARGRDQCPCKGGKSRNWQRVVTLLRETGDHNGLMGIQTRLNSQQNNPAHPFIPQPPGKEGKLFHLQMENEASQLNLKNLFSKLAGGMITVIEQATQNPHDKSRLVAQPVSFLNLVYHGRRAAPTIFYWAQNPQQPLKEAAVDTPSRRGNKNTVSVLEIKEPWIEIPFSCLENHWLSHEVFTVVVSTTRQWWSGTGISDCFFKAWRANPTDIASIMGQFFLLWSTFLITEHKIAKKSHWNYQTWPALNIRLSVIWSFSEGFSLI